VKLNSNTERLRAFYLSASALFSRITGLVSSVETFGILASP
jgi:hypothetical protein